MLAAGLGTRMRSRTPKLLHPLLGRPMLAYVVDAARAATDSRPVVVTSPATAGIRDAFGDDVDYALQPKPNGTGAALRVALEHVPDAIEEILVLNGDVPLLREDLLVDLLAERRLDHAAIAITIVDAIDPAGLGRVLRNDAGGVERVVEEKDAEDDERAINEINAGLYAFDASWLRQAIADLRPSEMTGELYLTALIEAARADGRIVAAVEVEDDGRLLGINDRAQLARAEWDLRVELNERWMLAGVTMHDPSTVYLDHAVELAEDVVLEPNVVLRGHTTVGEGTVIATGSQVHDSTIGKGCRIWASVIERSEVRDGATVGPFSHLRPGSVVGEHAEIGNFAELKNSTLGPGVKQHHMSYLGDARWVPGRTSGRARSPRTTTACRSTGRRSASGVFLGVDTMLARAAHGR